MANDNYNSSPFTPQYTLIQKIKELQDHVKTIYENEEQFNQRIAELESKSIQFIVLENVDLTADTSIDLDFSAADYGKASGVKNCKLFIICSHGPSEYGARPVIFELSKFKQDLSLNEITFNGNVFSVSSDDKYVDTISAVATFSLGKIRIKFARVSLNFDLETIPHIFEIGSSTDVTSVFNQLKVCDMINQGDERVYILSYIDNADSAFFVIDFPNDALGYWRYYKDGDNWIYDDSSSFNINIESGGSKLYKHNIKCHINNDSYYTLTIISSSNDEFTSGASLIDKLRNLATNGWSSSNTISGTIFADFGEVGLESKILAIYHITRVDYLKVYICDPTGSIVEETVSTPIVNIEEEINLL